MNNFFDLPAPNPAALVRSQLLSECIKQEMDKQGGQISFAAFMDLALYHPQYGYYNAETFTLGKQGDFTTATEISPLYASCFARQSLQLFDQLKQYTILEIGAGTGQFAHDILLELHELGCKVTHYYIYEPSASLRKKQQDFLTQPSSLLDSAITWLDALPRQFTGLIIANEVLDALPVHCFRIEDNQVQEKCVTWNHDQFIWTSRAPNHELKRIVNRLRKLYALPDGYESEVNLGLPSFIHTILGSLSQGLVLFADYGYGQREYYHPERSQGTLTSFYQHKRHSHPLILPGLQDITAHVDFTYLAELAIANQCQLAGFTTQAAFLLACGLLDIAAEKEKNLSPIDEFHLHQSIKLLTLPTEMGENVKIMALSKKMTLPLLGFGWQDRRRDL